VNPVNGDISVVWREFGQAGSADRILTAMSGSGGKTFGKVTEIASLGVPQAVNYWPSPVSSAFDQTTLPNAVVTDVRMARTNGYPSACYDTNGQLRVVFSKRIPQPVAPVIKIDIRGNPQFFGRTTARRAAALTRLFRLDSRAPEKRARLYSAQKSRDSDTA